MVRILELTDVGLDARLKEVSSHLAYGLDELFASVSRRAAAAELRLTGRMISIRPILARVEKLVATRMLPGIPTRTGAMSRAMASVRLLPVILMLAPVCARSRGKPETSTVTLG
jgi:hypothetical protein